MPDKAAPNMNAPENSESVQGANSVEPENPAFVGRGAELIRLREILGDGQTRKVAFVHAPGGMGKSALAHAYAHRHAAAYPIGRWVLRCEGKTDLTGEVAALSTAVGVSPNAGEKNDLESACLHVMAQLERRALTESLGKVAANQLSKGNSARCLFLLDNLDKPELLESDLAVRLLSVNWLDVIVTTRLDPQLFSLVLRDRAAVVSLGELPAPDAVNLLQQHRKFVGTSETEAASAIARRLGGFPLAVEAVAGFLALHPDISLAAFRENFDADGFAGQHEAPATEAGDIKITPTQSLLARSFLPLLNSLSVGERCALRFAALLPPDYIPLPWLCSLVAHEYPEIIGEMLWWQRLIDCRLLVETSDRDEAGLPRVVRMHRLVQELILTRADFDPEQLATVLLSHAETRCVFLSEGWLQTKNRWELGPLKEFAFTLLASDESNAAWVATHVGKCLAKLGEYSTAEALFRQALEKLERILEQDHPETMWVLNDLANALWDQGKFPEAESHYRHVLATRKRELGLDHPDTLQSINNLAGLLWRRGQYASSESLYQQALTGMKQALGPAHPDTLMTMHNLAGAVMQRGDPTGAELLYREALEARRQLLGPKHPDSLVTMNNLALALDHQRKHAEAASMFREALAISEEVLGPEHPSTLAKMKNLAGVLLGKHAYAEAEALYRRSLAAQERVLGQEHPDTLGTAHNLAVLLARRGNQTEAESLFRRTLERTERALGLEHPHTQGTRDALERIIRKRNGWLARMIRGFKKQ